MNLILPLECISQNYKWGNFGDCSSVSRLLKGSNKEFVIDPNVCYAELWMGSHPSGPSKIHLKGEESILLSNYIQKDPSTLMGDDVIEKFNGDFPFLFKILSVRTSLSIQSHPDKILAKELHQKFPDIYTDPYHKPEVAIALTEFHILCGFRNLNEILGFIENIAELKSSLESNLNLNDLNKDNCKLYLKTIVTSLLNVKEEIIKENLKHLNDRLLSQSTIGTSDLDKLVLKLYSQYPGDVGVFFAYILNYIVLKPGESLFLAPGEPHAYLSGDCVECMAPSNNVVRAGLTPKLKDVHTLGEMLTYTTGIPECIKPIVESFQNGNVISSIYRPPVEEFEIEKIDFKVSNSLPITIKPCSGPSILIVIDGTISISNSSNTLSNLPTGSIYFISSDCQYQVESSKSTIYIARVNQKFFSKSTSKL